MASEDVVLSLGFDLSSIPKAIATIERTLKNQKLVANLAYQFGSSQGQVRSQLKNFISSLQKDINSSPLNIPLEADNLPRIRYALYDVSSITDRVAQSLRTFGVTAIDSAAQFETAFTDVERTTMANTDLLGSMRSQLEGLARDIPVAFKDITEIASLGAQLGIATGDLAGFAETVAQFSSVTNVSTQSAAQSFGALGELLNVSASEYQNLGSSIAQVGVNSVATESEILSVATQIGGIASSAGLSADYVVGLSGALASLRIPAEQSRGALTRVFQEINRAAAEGGPAIDNFAKVLGVSTEEASKLAQTDVETFFSKFITGLSGLDNTQLTTTLDALNLSELRVTNTLTRLAENTDLISRTQSDASKAYEDGTFLAAAYALKVDDLASKLTILQNSFQELVATFGESITPIIGPIVDGISNMVQGITDALSTDSGKWTSGILVGSALVVSGLLTLISTVALVTASLFALKTAIDGLGWTAAMGGMKGLAASIWGTGAAATGATAGVKAMSFALKAIPIIAIIGALGALAVSFYEAGKSADTAFNKFVGNTAGLSEAIMADTDAYRQLDAAGKAAAAGGIATVDYAGTSLNQKYGDASQKLYYTAQVLGKDVPDAAYAASSALEYNTRIIGDNTQAWFNNMLMQSEAFQELAGSEEFANFIQKTGADVSQAFLEQAQKGGDAAREYYFTVAREALTNGDITIEEIAAVDAQMANALQSNANTWATADTSGPSNWLDRQITDLVKGIPILGDIILKIAGLYDGNIFSKGTKNYSDSVTTISKLTQGAANKLAILDLSNKKVASSSSSAADGMRDLGSATDSAAKKVYTLVDYANDLSSIWDRAFDIRFSGIQTFDKITSAFSRIAKSAADARQEIEDINNSINDLKADISSLTADRALQQYFLSIAEAYGDTLRAQEIRANLNKIDADLISKNADLTKKNKDLQRAQDKTNKTLVGNSDAAIENRSEILNLVNSYQDHIKALAASGLTQDQLRTKTQQLKNDFIAQATQLGYNINELGDYVSAFEDVKVAIDNVPRDITVTANTNPALQALNEYEARLREIGGKTYGGGTVTGANYGNAARINELEALITRYSTYASSMAERRAWAASDQALSAVRRYQEELVSLRGYADGGYTGSGGKYEIAGVVHRGEYVVPKQQVNQSTGLPYFMSQAPKFYSGGSTSGSGNGTMMVSLSPEDRAILRSAGGTGEIVLYANNEALARSANAGNRSIVAAGGRP